MAQGSQAWLLVKLIGVLFGQVSAHTGGYQLPILGCTKCTRKDMLAHNLGSLSFDDAMSYNSLTTVFTIVQYDMPAWIDLYFLFKYQYKMTTKVGKHCCS